MGGGTGSHPHKKGIRNPELEAAVITLLILLKIVLMLLATPGMIAPAATATKPAIKAYSMRSWPRVSFQILSCQTRFVSFFMLFISPCISGISSNG